ncbi:hypothetical protein HanHA89_Chr16g0670881 [Helianthus annuus]|uniref:Uncharacterized protein n=1 Tax=Helianthus annuus TaxID=4232 RepID=A0A251S248_HELAN|nr:hypothetical protein HanHA89_Chr16g0670881 [Helianthus annuus]
MRVRMGSSKQVGSVRVTFVRIGLERLTQRSTCAVLGYACTGLRHWICSKGLIFFHLNLFIDMRRKKHTVSPGLKNNTNPC